MQRVVPVIFSLIVAGPAAAQVVRQESGTRTEFRGLHAASESVVWATGRNGWYTRTGDGGTAWRADTIPGAGDLFLVDVHAFDERNACVLGTSFDGGFSRIYRTADDGATWSVVFERRGEGVFFDGMAFWDDTYGAAFSDPVDGEFLIVRSADGCRSWTEVPAENLPAPLDGEAGFAASGTAIAVQADGSGWIGTGGGAVARVLRTADRGATWTAHETPHPGGQTSGIFGVTFRDARHGVAVGGNYREETLGPDNILGTTDGGRTWYVAGTSAPSGVRWGAASVAGERGVPLVAVGPTGIGVSLDDGATWTAIDTVRVNTVALASSRAGWAAGTAGRIFRFNPVGRPPNE